jgi:hypothetical protein
MKNERPTETAERQEVVDRFYWSRGVPCCAGCDHWRHLNSVYGECRRSAPVSASERWEMTGITDTSLRSGAGHVMTPRDHSCGEFADTFDWSALSLAYLCRIGAPR